MKITDHVIERVLQREPSLREQAVQLILESLEGIAGVIFKDPKHGMRCAIAVEHGIYICNSRKTAVITYINNDNISQDHLRDIYRRRKS